MKVAYCTDRGLVRENNEDYLFVDEERGIFIVADGMGGHQAGDVASRVATEVIGKVLRAFWEMGFSQVEEEMKKAIQEANEKIYALAHINPDLEGMGTTVVAACLLPPLLYVAWVGDSRAYLIRDEGITLLTRDDSIVEEYVRDGLITPEEARRHPHRHMLTQALGTDISLAIHTEKRELREKDCLLLCSDGLTEALEDEEIKKILSDTSPQDSCKRMVEMANQREGKDNLTAIIIRI